MPKANINHLKKVIPTTSSSTVWIHWLWKYNQAPTKAQIASDKKTILSILVKKIKKDFKFTGTARAIKFKYETIEFTAKPTWTYPKSSLQLEVQLISKMGGDAIKPPPPPQPPPPSA